MAIEFLWRSPEIDEANITHLPHSTLAIWHRRAGIIASLRRICTWCDYHQSTERQNRL